MGVASIISQAKDAQTGSKG
jgi:hypothetical protein